MARDQDLQSLVEHFVSQIRDHITRQIDAELAGKIDAFKASLLGGGAGAGAAPAAPARGRAVGAVRAPGRRGPPAGYEAEEKPCPICGKKNKARRFSYLCEQHRTEENKRKFKGAAAKAAPAAPAGKAGRPAAKRGPGRPKGSKNKPKTEASASA